LLCHRKIQKVTAVDASTKMEKDMTFQRITQWAIVGVGGTAAAITLGMGTATAAPSGQSATETIARLQADGNRVIVNKVGTGPMEDCSVTSVRPLQSPPLPTGNALTGVPNLQRTTTVHVGLKC
jgi:hypothetical protein